MGHADGVCHVYVDSAADLDKARAVLLDAKTDYPSACNAAETLLLHEDTLSPYETAVFVILLLCSKTICYCAGLLLQIACCVRSARPA